jgi:thioredoxin-like negative regulator of GroEL
VNVDNDRDIARLFKVQSIPFVALVKDNTFVDMSVGYVPKEAIAKLIREYM